MRERGIAACICMHRNDMEKGAHKLLLYFVAIFILPTLVRKLRDETTRREEIAQRACMCVWAAWLAAWLAAWICIYVANTVTQQSPPPSPCLSRHAASGCSVNSRQTRRIRDIYERYAANGSAVCDGAIFQRKTRQNKRAHKTKQRKANKKKKKKNKNKIEN